MSMRQIAAVIVIILISIYSSSGSKKLDLDLDGKVESSKKAKVVISRSAE